MNVASYCKTDRRLNHEVDEACDLNCFLGYQAVLEMQFLKKQVPACKRGLYLEKVFQEALTGSFTLGLL